jgi:RND family efflux transporter MFP subunit
MSKNYYMKNILHLGVFGAIVFLSSCGASSSKPEDNSLAGKKAKLEKLKEEESRLEDEIAKLDTSSVKKEKTRLVGLDSVKLGSFTHYIDLQGRIDAENIAYVTPRGAGGQVKGLFVKKGDEVRKGQLLLKLDDALVKRQMEQLQPQLDNAQTLYQRQKNLWDQQIGTEVQLLNYKTQLESMQKQMAFLNEQLSFTNVNAEMDGIAEDVTIRVGEFFSGNPQSGGYIRLVNTKSLKAIAQVPESYLGRVKVGSSVQVVFPEINNKTINTRITTSGKLIDANTRSFWVEAKIPEDKDFHPNQIALVKIQDYSTPNAVTVPVNTLQTDEKGKYVLVAVKEGDRMVARKKSVQIGQLYNDRVEIKTGLTPGDAVITEGFQGLYDGQAITTSI